MRGEESKVRQGQFPSPFESQFATGLATLALSRAMQSFEALTSYLMSTNLISDTITQSRLSAFGPRAVISGSSKDVRDH